MCTAFGVRIGDAPMSDLKGFPIALTLGVFVLAFGRCLVFWVPGVDYPDGPAWNLYVEAMLRASLEALVVIATCYLGLKASRARGNDLPISAGIVLSMPLAAIALLEHRVKIPVTTPCSDGHVVCNPYGLQLFLESHLHFLILAVASLLATFAAGRGRRGRSRTT